MVATKLWVISERWLTEIESSGRAVQTVKAYRTRLKLLSSVLKKDTDDLKPSDFKEIFDNLSKIRQPSYVRDVYDTAKGLLNWMDTQGYKLPDNLLSTSRIPKAKPHDPCIMDGAGMQTLIDQSKGTELFLPIVLGCSTGMRKGEILALQWQDVDFEGKSLTVDKSLIGADGFSKGKGKRPRTIRLGDDIVDALEQVYHKRLKHTPEKRLMQDYICQTIRGRRFDPHYFSRRFNKFKKENGVSPELRFHDLRWSFINSNVRIYGAKETAEIVGHHSAVYTLDYYYRCA